MRKKTKSAFRWLRSEALNLLKDAFLAGGFFCVVKGIWMIYEPAAWLAGGAMLLYAGFPTAGGDGS